MTLLSSDELNERVWALPALKPLLEAAAGLEQSVYLVGGAARDLMTGGSPVDIDVCVEGPITELLERLPGDGTVHQQFGTATITHGGLRYDIAQARTERYPEPGALPQVQPSNIASDLRRRDFTVNAIALNLSTGELISVEDALEDLDSRRLEVLHDRSFCDDPTRLLRLVRYQARLGFEVGAVTARLAHKALGSRVLENVSGARIGNELRLLASEPDPVASFMQLAALDRADTMLPGFGLTGDISIPLPVERQIADSMRLPVNPQIASTAVATKALAILPAGGRRDLVVLSVCAVGMASASLTQLLDRLAFAAQDRATIVSAATRSQLLAAALLWAQRPSQIANAVAGAGVEEVALAGALGAETQAVQWLECLRHMRLAVRGDDLTAEGLSSGPAIGAGLNAARMAMLDGNAQDRASQLRIALETARKL